MLEGKELEGNIGSAGGYSVDVDQYGLIRAEVSGGIDGVKGGAFVEMHIIMLLKMLAAKSDTQLDDQAVAFIENLLAKKPEEAKPE